MSEGLLILLLGVPVMLWMMFAIVWNLCAPAREKQPVGDGVLTAARRELSEATARDMDADWLAAVERCAERVAKRERELENGARPRAASPGRKYPANDPARGQAHVLTEAGEVRAVGGYYRTDSKEIRALLTGVATPNEIRMRAREHDRRVEELKARIGEQKQRMEDMGWCP